jgi:flagellar hook assembly protein FlgD
MTGQLVRQVAQGRFASGEHQVVWDGNDGSGRRVANGVYFYQLTAGEFQSTKRMLLLK